MNNFKLIYRPEEHNHWHRVEMPDINDYGYFESDPEIPGSGWEKKEYDEAVKKAIDEAKPIAPQDQEKIDCYLELFNHHITEGSKWIPDPSKLYDSGDLEFELETQYWDDELGCYVGAEDDDTQHSIQFWVLKSKVEEIEEPMNISTSEKGNSSHCIVCGRFLVTVRGRHPNDPERKTCPQCTLEKLEQIGDLFIQATVKQPKQ